MTTLTLLQRENAVLAERCTMLEMVASVRDSQAQRLQMIQQGGPVNSVLLSVMGFTVEVGQLCVSGPLVDVYSLDDVES
jgi:hypothetical protein